VTLSELRTTNPGVRLAYEAFEDQLESIGQRFVAKNATPRGLKKLPTYDLHDVLVAYLILANDLMHTDGEITRRARWIHNARLITAYVFANSSDPLLAVRTFVDIAETYPENALILSLALADQPTAWSIALADTDDLGRLSRDVYEAAGLSALMDRTSYLVRRLTSGRLLPAAQRAQRDFAITLAYGWAGTLAALSETAATLRHCRRASLADDWLVPESTTGALSWS